MASLASASRSHPARVAGSLIRPPDQVPAPPPHPLPPRRLRLRRGGCDRWRDSSGDRSRRDPQRPLTLVTSSRGCRSVYHGCLHSRRPRPPTPLLSPPPAPCWTSEETLAHHLCHQCQGHPDSSRPPPQRAIAAVQLEQAVPPPPSPSPPCLLPFCVRHGFDLHRLEPGLLLIIGGIGIPHDRGCESHSDMNRHALEKKEEHPEVMNAFEIISRSRGLNLGNLSDVEQDYKRETRFSSNCLPKKLSVRLKKPQSLLAFIFTRKTSR